MITKTQQASAPQPSQWQLAVRTTLRGAGQVMFQCSSWTGLLFFIGIFWGAYASHTPAVAWGAVVGTVAATVAGYIVGLPKADGDSGLWGFNGILIGCAFPTFMENTWLMWLCLIFFSMLTTWVRTGFNNVMRPWKVNSLTFPFVFLTWVMLFSTRILDGVDVTTLPEPELPHAFSDLYDGGIGHIVEYWLKGVAQVFLINNWVTGILFLVGLWLCSRWAAIWAAVGSAIGLGVAILFGADGADITNGLFGYSPVLTGIAIGCTFNKVNVRSAVWTVAAIVATVFIQAAMDVMLTPWGLPALTGPFCVATWLFLLPLYKFRGHTAPDYSEWTDEARRAAGIIDNELLKGADEVEKKL
ncbi:MAG: urea transporter [Muribaculaceae bacterium]|nr:urea transporter [Muribaculaceae bacterium]